MRSFWVARHPTFTKWAGADGGWTYDMSRARRWSTRLEAERWIAVEHFKYWPTRPVIYVLDVGYLLED